MKYYVVGEVEITDQSWVPDYIRNVTEMVERRGGRYLARTSIVERMEGDRKPPQILVILEWHPRRAQWLSLKAKSTGHTARIAPLEPRMSSCWQRART